MSLWYADRPLVLASRSEIRRALLEAAGIPVETIPADIDERAIEANAGSSDPAAVASLLAREKAGAISARLPGRLVLGADQTLSLGQRRFSKPANREAGRAQLMALRGRTHELHSGIAVVQDGGVMYEHRAVARLTMRQFSEGFLESYLDLAGEAVTASVGGYQLEKLGIQLFERVEGDHATILGLPLMPLLHYLRQRGLLAG